MSHPAPGPPARRGRAGTAVVAALVLALLLAAVGGVALVAAGSGRGEEGPSLTVAPAPSGADARLPAGPGLAGFYAQTLDWTSCRDGLRCARLRVPLDYRRPGGDTLELALLKVAARLPAQRVGALVVNPGGPGAPGTSYAAGAADAFREPLLDHFDIVGFDPRGTGDSDPVDCLSDDQLDEYVAADPDPDTPAEVAAVAAGAEAIGRGCVERSGDLAAHVSTIEAARDLDVLRAALGESRLTYLGASYGTKLGATYADLFPQRVGRFVLDGAVDPSLAPRELALQQAHGFETALRAYVAGCVASPGCPLGGSVEEGLTRIRDFLDEVDTQPLETGTDRELRVGNAFYGVVLPLYNRDYWGLLSQALRDGFDGDGALLLRLSDAYTSRGPEGYLDNSMEALYAISCLDEPYAVPAARVPASVPAFEQASPTFGRVFAWQLTGCAGQRARAEERPREIHAGGAPPIVVVGTTRDPATPMAWAVDLAGQLESGVLVRRDGDGHTGYNNGNACVDEAVEAYLVSDLVPADGLSC